VSVPDPIPKSKHRSEDFLASIEPQHLVYFLLNVGDADTQLVLLPEDPLGRRRAVVVDVATKRKLPAPTSRRSRARPGAPAEPGPDGRPDGSIALVVASHPHADHIGGIAELLESHAERIAEFWDPGYFHTTPTYHQMMAAVEANPHLTYAQPTAGYRRWFGSALITVLSPSVGLRNRFDTYGTEVNDASISLRVEFPAARVVLRGEGRELLDQPNTMAMILGADAQTLSWSQVLSDFPQLHASHSDAARAIGAATGRDLLSARVLKVSHHGSKRGVNLELVERIRPSLTLVSNSSGGGHGFPHGVAQELIREALQAIATGGQRKKDWELGLFYTSDSEEDGAPLGSVALVMGAGRAALWRFGDGTTDLVELARAKRWVG
jgi:beta-lactamase superfamily II metal-dependent hydrolase